MKYNRDLQIASVIKKELSKVLTRVITEKYSNIISINYVAVSKDLRQAKIYYNLFDETLKKEVADLLANNNGLLRKYVGKNLYMKYIPSLTFKYDEDLSRINRLERTFRKIDEDKKVI